MPRTYPSAKLRSVSASEPIGIRNKVSYRGKNQHLVTITSRTPKLGFRMAQSPNNLSLRSGSKFIRRFHLGRHVVHGASARLLLPIA